MKVHFFQGKKALAAAVAGQLVQGVSEKSIKSVGICGGESPRELLQQLAKNYESIKAAQLSWYLVDERLRVSSKAELNAQHIRGILGIDVCFKNEVLDPESAVEQWDECLAALRVERSQPGFDLLILGLGWDGHIASWFPPDGGVVELSPRNIVAKTASTSHAYQRVTILPQTLFASKEVWIIAQGENKLASARHLLTDMSLAGTVLRNAGHVNVAVDLASLPELAQVHCK